jgi:hypothetical protein
MATRKASSVHPKKLRLTMSSAHDSKVRDENTPLVSAAFERLIQATKRLLRDLASGMDDSLYFDEVRERLGGVPLSRGEYARAVSRLGNAIGYAAETETGGATYEVTQLLRSLIRRRLMSEM